MVEHFDERKTYLLSFYIGADPVPHQVSIEMTQDYVLDRTPRQLMHMACVKNGVRDQRILSADVALKLVALVECADPA